jgi:sugar phosphate isomerase/epimerase
VGQILDCIRDLRFEGVEIRGLEGEMWVPASPHLRPGSDFLAELHRLGCVVACLGSSASFGKPDAAVEEWKAYIEAASAIGCKLVRVFGGQLPEGMDRAQAARAMAPALREACDFAAQRGVFVGLETHDAWCRCDQVAMILEAADHPALKVIWDCHHSLRQGETPGQSLAAVGDALVHVHLKDGFMVDGKAQYRLFGEGDLPLREVLQTLKDAGYEGYLSLEWEKKWHPNLPEPEVAFPQFRRKLDELLASLE